MAKKQTLGVEENEKPDGVYSSKKMLKEHGEKGTKIKYTDRLTVKMIKATRFLKVGQVLSPSKIKGQAMIDQGVAVKFTEPEK